MSPPFAGIFPITTHPDLPPGVLAIHGTWEHVTLFDPAPLSARVAALKTAMDADPVLAAKLGEDLASLTESADYLIRPGDSTAPITCESCGTSICETPEWDIKADSRNWQRGIWEAETARRHTARRCRAQREGRWERP